MHSLNHAKKTNGPIRVMRVGDVRKEVHNKNDNVGNQAKFVVKRMQSVKPKNEGSAQYRADGGNRAHSVSLEDEERITGLKTDIKQLIAESETRCVKLKEVNDKTATINDMIENYEKEHEIMGGQISILEREHKTLLEENKKRRSTVFDEEKKERLLNKELMELSS